VRIAKSSKEQDGYEAPDTTGARLARALEAPERHRQVTTGKIKKPDFGFKRGERFFSRSSPVAVNRGDMSGWMAEWIGRGEFTDDFLVTRR